MADITTLLVKYQTETTELKRAKAATDKLAKEIRNTEINMSDLDKKQRKVYDSIVKNSGKARTAQESLTDKVKGLAAGYLSFQAIKGAVKTFASFDDALKRTQALTGGSAEDLKKLEQQSRLLGKTTAFSASQVAEAQGNMAQSGLSVNQILDATSGVLNLASAAQIDMATATDLTTSTLNIFGLEANKATSVADVLAMAQSKSAGNAQWFGMAIQNVGANAKSLGYNLEQTTAILATMAPAFKEGGSAGTSLNAILRDMTAKMDKQGRIMINGKKVMVAQNGTMLSMDKIINNVSKATQGMSDVQKRQALATFLGDEAMRGFNVLLGQGSCKITEFTKLMNNSSGTSAKMASILESGLGGSLRTLWSSIEAVTISFVDFFAPAIKSVVEIATGFLSITDNIIGLYKEYPVLLGTVTTALLAYKYGQMGIVAAQTLINATNPFGWMKLAIAGVIVVISFLENRFQLVSKIFEKLKGLLSGITSFFSSKDEKNVNLKTTTEQVTNTTSDTVDNLPKHALGTNNSRRGLALVGERGPEIVNLSSGSQVVPTEETRQLLKGGNSIGGDIINITLNSNGDDSILDRLKEFLEERDRRNRDRIRMILGGV